MTSTAAGGTALKQARLQAGLSQRELAERARTAQSVVARIEAGAVSPSLDTLARLLEAAGTELQLRVVPKAPRDPVVDAYKPGVDRTLLSENVRKSPRERIENLVAMQRFAEQARNAGAEALRRKEKPGPQPGKPE